jgi:hypothetical protein
MSSAPIVDRIRIIPRPTDFLDRNVGSSGEVFFSKDTNSLRVYSGKDRSGFEIARADLDNVLDADLEARITALGITGGSSGGASVDVSETAPTEPEAGNLWLNTTNGRLYIYVNDGDTSQWMQPAVPVFSGSYNDLSDKPALATVATSGSYNDLTDKPVISESGFDGDYSSLSNKPTIPADVSDLTDTTNLLDHFSGDYDDLTNKPTSFGNLTLTGLTTLQQTTEVVSGLTGATGTVDHNLNNGAVFLHTLLAADFTANFTNVPTTDFRTISVALILEQGSTAYIPTAVQIDGAAQTINWQGASAPTGNANQIDVVSFTLIRTPVSWIVIGSLTTYG